MARRRTWWRRVQPRLDLARLVFIDETWTKTNMTRLRGWCLRGAPLMAKVPHGHWKTMTFLAALRSDGITAPCVFDGPINGESFRAWVEQFLVPRFGLLACGVFFLAITAITVHSLLS